MNTLPQLAFDFNPAKRCVLCRLFKNPEHFHKDSSRNDGLNARCKQCVSEYQKANKARYSASARRWQEANPERAKATQAKWQKAHPVNSMSAGYARKLELNKQWLQNLTGEAKTAFMERKKERNKRWRASLTPEHRARLHAKRTNDGRRRTRDPILRSVYKSRYEARLKSAPGKYSKQEWAALCAQYSNQCLRCGATGGYLSPDHVVPLSRGGSNDIANIQPLCLRCNKSKNAKTIDYRTGGNK